MGAINFDKPSEGNVDADSKPAIKVTNKGKNSVGVSGVADADKGTGVYGESNNWIAVHGQSQEYQGVHGNVTSSGHGVVGTCHGEEGSGVWGVADAVKATGVVGESEKGIGVLGKGPKAGRFEGNVEVTGYVQATGVSCKSSLIAVSGESSGMYGVSGISPSVGVYGRCTGNYSGVFGESFGSGPLAAGVYGRSTTSYGVVGKARIAGRFEGDVEVTGDIKLVNPMNADCAEDFDILEENVEPGTVMVLTESGRLQSSHQEYDKKVAGVISGAGGCSPALILGRQQSQNPENKNKDRLPIALMGKVFCKVDARESPIEIGDLLTTSSTKGYAMKADDGVKAFGAVIGKALGSIKEGLGMIPVLVTLQ